MRKDEWKDDASCKDYDTNLFFEKYENNTELRPAIDTLCSGCPVARTCFAVGISEKGWGVWGGVYMENGKISREFNKHRNKQQWSETWQNLTMD